MTRFLSKTLSAARLIAPSLLWHFREALVAWLLAAVMLGAVALIPSRERGAGDLTLSRLRSPAATHFTPLLDATRAREQDAAYPCEFEQDRKQALASVRQMSDVEDC